MSQKKIPRPVAPSRPTAHPPIYGGPPATGDYPQYTKTIKGIRIDPYRICKMYGITDPAVQHALKKLLRAGKDHLTFVEDITEARDSLNRAIEMVGEDAGGIE